MFADASYTHTSEALPCEVLPPIIKVIPFVLSNAICGADLSAGKTEGDLFVHVLAVGSKIHVSFERTLPDVPPKSTKTLFLES